MRDIPIITFINKMDREALDPFELLDEVHAKLALDVSPLMWPAGSGQRFRGVPHQQRALDGQRQAHRRGRRQ
jgi:peptide chain release factor 3